MNMNEVITNVTLTKVCSVKPFKGATESKQVTLVVKYDGLTISAVFAKALGADVISWANGSGGRSNYKDLVDKSIINISAKSPGAMVVDPETAMVAKLITMTPDEQKVYLQELAAKAAGVAPEETKETETVVKIESP